MTSNTNPIVIKNIYYMMAYAFQALQLEQYEDLDGETFEHMHDLFAAILAKGISCQAKRGLYQEYVAISDNLTTVRGRIITHDTLRNRLARRQRIACNFDELTDNNLVNQVLKTTALLLLRHGEIANERRSALRKVLPYLSNIDELVPTRIPWEKIHLQRANRQNRFLLNVCHLVLEGMLISDQKGQLQLARYVDEQKMCRLFEKFILEYFKAEHTNISTSSPQIKWALDDDNAALLPRMQTDVMLSRGASTLIIDAKFYGHATQHHYGADSIRSNNLYQIFTYVKNKEAELAYTGEPHCVSGMLLYALAVNDAPFDEIYQMSGNRISVKTLDLNKPFDGIRNQLDEIAASHFA